MTATTEANTQTVSVNTDDTVQPADLANATSNNEPSTKVNKEEVAEPKKDETVAPVPSTSTAAPAAPDGKVKNVRGTKRPRVEAGEASDKKDGKDDPEAEAKVMRSLKRSSELWSMEDKNIFFKAVNEYGKDFDALQAFFLSHGKRRGTPENMIKNKEQIRHFYYRTWLKISKHLKFSEDVKKTTQELYGLINFGELRRKLPRMHEKVQMKLNELVYWGSTQVRLRGKTMRIKTPICRALRKLNKLEGLQEYEIKLPSRVTIELRPANNYTWWQIQGLGMNPRVRTLVPIQRRLFSILSFLQQRWRPWKPKVQIGATEDQINTVDPKNNNILRVAPPKNSKICVPEVNLGEYLTSTSVSFNAFENREKGLKSSRIPLLGTMQYLKGQAGKKNVRKVKVDKTSPNTPKSALAEPQVAKNSKRLNQQDKPGTSQTQPSEPNVFPGRENVERIKLGWNIDEANTITVGDMFLMFGKDSKISLEYWWELKGSTAEQSNCDIPPENSLSTALQRLLSLAKHNYTTGKVYENASSSNETIISSRVPSTTKETVFRTPFIPKPYHRIGSSAESFKDQLDRFKSRNSRKGRFLMQRNLVVQRVRPAPPPPEDQLPQQIAYPQEQVIPVGDKTITLTIIPNDQNADPQMISTVSNDPTQFEIVTANNGQLEKANSNASITSAMQILKEGEQQWLNSEVADYSLSSFLGQLESPIKSAKNSQAGVPILEVIRPSSDVSNIHSLIGESSFDYVTKFANYASQMVSAEEDKP